VVDTTETYTVNTGAWRHVYVPTFRTNLLLAAYTTLFLHFSLIHL